MQFVHNQMEINVMKNFLKKYWWVLLLIILAPALINWCILQPAIFPFVGCNTDWLNFWGAYVGSILSSIIAFYVLHKQLQQNHKENEENRKLQIFILKQQWIAELREKMEGFIKAFHYRDMAEYCYSLFEQQQQSTVLVGFKQITEELSLADFNKGIIFQNPLDDIERKSLKKLCWFTTEYFAILDDLMWYANTFAYKDKAQLSDLQWCEEETDTFERKNEFKSDAERIWTIIRNHNYDIINKNKEIIAERIVLLYKGLTTTEIVEVASQLINYEQY